MEPKVHVPLNTTLKILKPFVGILKMHGIEFQLKNTTLTNMDQTHLRKIEIEGHPSYGTSKQRLRSILLGFSGTKAMWIRG